MSYLNSVILQNQMLYMVIRKITIDNSVRSIPKSEQTEEKRLNLKQ